MNEEIEQLKIDNQELLEDNAWWQRRFNAVQRDYENLQDRIDEAIEYINEDIKANYFKIYDDEVYKMCDDLLKILGDKE